MANDFSEEMKISLVADLRTLEADLRQGRMKTKAEIDKINQESQIKLRVNMADLDSKIADARKRLTQFRKEGDKAGEIKTRLEISGLQQTKGQASKLLKELQNDAKNTEKSFFSLNSIIASGLKVFGGFVVIRKAADELRSAFDASVSFESAFAGIRKTVDASEAEFGQLADQFRNLAKEIPLSVEELAKIGETAGQLGVKKNDILAFTKTIAAIGVSTNLTTEEAATSFARIANIFQQPVDQVSNLASSVVALGNNFATTETEILAFTTRIAGAGKIAGLSTADLAGISTAFTSVGIEAEAGGTAVAKTLQSISDAVLKGGADLQGFAKVSGVSAQDFANLWKSAPAKAFDLFIQGLGKSGEFGASILENLVAGDERLKRAFLSVAGAGDKLTQALNLSNISFGENTALTNEAEKRYATTESQLQLLASRFNDVKINAGNFLKQAALPILDFFTTLVEAFGGAQNSLTGFANLLKAIATALAGLFSLNQLSKFAQGLQGIGGKILEMAKAFDVGVSSGKGLKGALDALKVGFGSIISLPGVVALAIGTLAFAFIDSANKARELENATKSLGKTLGELKTPSLQSQGSSLQGAITGNQEANKNAQIAQFQQGQQFGAIPSLFGVGGQEVAEANALAKQSTQELRVEIESLLSSMGATNEEVANFTSTLGIFNGEATLSKEEIQAIENEVGSLSSKMPELASNFESSVEAQVKAGATWKDAIRNSVEANKKQYGDNVKNVDEMVDNIQETFVANVAKSGDVGKAAMIAYSSGFSSSEARKTISDAVGGLTDEQLLIQLNAAVQSGDRGKAAGLLYALGVGTNENLQAVQNSGNNLNNAVISAFDNARGSIFASGKGSGQSLVGGIITGIQERIPFLSNIVSRIAEALGGFASLGDTFKGLAASIPVIGAPVAALTASFGALANKGAKLKQQFQSIQNLGGAGPGGGGNPLGPGGGGGGKKGGGGGGGANKALEEAKKKAQEAEKAVDEFTKSIRENNKAAEKLRSETVEFYKDIIDSIDRAREKQAELTGEFEKFKGEQEKEFALDAAEKDVKLQQELLEIAEKLKDAQDQLNEAKEKGVDATVSNETALSNALKSQAIAQQKLNEALQTGKNVDSAQLAADKAAQKVQELKANTSEILTDDQKRQEELLANITKILDEQNEKLKERQQIQDYLNGLSKDTTELENAYNEALKSGDAAKIESAKASLDKAKADKEVFDAFEEQRRRQGLTEFEQGKLELEDKLKAKKTEVDAEKDKQQKIIDIQNQFLALQNAKSAEELKKKQDLINLATTQELLSQEEKKKKLEELGFKDLNVEEQAALFKQVSTISGLETELSQIEQQQQEILETRQKYIDLATQYQGEKIDEMKEKEQELIDLIQQAQAEQIKLNDLAGIGTKAGSVINNTTNVNVNNNIASNVDFQAGNNSLLRKIK